jgi:hypothetical protein
MPLVACPIRHYDDDGGSTYYYLYLLELDDKTVGDIKQVSSKIQPVPLPWTKSPADHMLIHGLPVKDSLLPMLERYDWSETLISTVFNMLGKVRNPNDVGLEQYEEICDYESFLPTPWVSIEAFNAALDLVGVPTKTVYDMCSHSYNVSSVLVDNKAKLRFDLGVYDENSGQERTSWLYLDLNK